MRKRSAFKSLAEYLEATGTTQQEFADRVGVHQVTVSKIARGWTPSVELAVRIARETRIPVESLLPQLSEAVR